MSETGRKDVHDKVKETLTPDAMKSDSQKAKETVTDTGDRLAREVQPDTSKTNTQEATDRLERGKDNAVHGSTHETVGDKIKHAVGLDKKDH